jgi:hypothetical protein
MADVKVQFEGDIGDLARGNAELISQFAAFDETLKNVARTAGKSKTEVGGVKAETKGFASAADEASKLVVNWVSGFAGLAGVKKLISAITAELKEQQQMQKEMLGTAVDLDRLAQGLAMIKPGGINKANIESARTEIQNLALQAKVDLDTARQSLFFAYSAYGDTEAGRGAALTTAKIAATGQLTPEQISSLPALFNLMGAKTEKEQMAAAGQLVTATKASIAETGPYIPAFVKSYQAPRLAGFTYEEALAMMNTAIMTTGGNVEEAGTRMQAAIRYTGLSPSPKAVKYLTKEAQERGMDFTKLTARQRVELAGQAYRQAMEEGSQTEFSAAFGAKAMQGIGGLFTPEAQEEYQRVLGILQTSDTGMIAKDWAGYAESLPAREATGQTKRTIAEAGTGRQRELPARFDKLVENIQRQAHATMEGPWETMQLALAPKSFEKWDIAQTLIHESLMKEYQKLEPTDPQAQRLSRLMKTQPMNLTQNQDYLQEVYEETGGFSNLAGADLKHKGISGRAISEYLSKTGMTEGTAQKLIASLDRNSDATEKQNAVLVRPASPQVFVDW